VRQVTGWTVSSLAGTFRPSGNLSFELGEVQGSQVAFVQQTSFIQQTVSGLTLQPGQVVTIVAAVGWRKESATVGAGAIVAITGAGLSFETAFAQGNLTQGAFTDIALVVPVPANAGQTLAVRLVYRASSGQVNFDNVRVFASNP
jgi:hypothetical protein